MPGNHANKYKISNKLSESGLVQEIRSTSASFVFIADFTLRTHNARGVEVHEAAIPDSPDGPMKPMDGFLIHNENNILFNVGVYSDGAFMNVRGEVVKHPEGVFFPDRNNDQCWLASIEIKDCAPDNITNFNAEIKKKFINNRTELLRRGVASESNVFYGIASFPRARLDFDDTIFNDQFVQLDFIRDNRVILFAANTVAIFEDTVAPIF